MGEGHCPPGIGHALHGHLRGPGHHAGVLGRNDDGWSDGVCGAPYSWREDRCQLGTEAGNPIPPLEGCHGRPLSSRRGGRWPWDRHPSSPRAEPPDTDPGVPSTSSADGSPHSVQGECTGDLKASPAPPVMQPLPRPHPPVLVFCLQNPSLHLHLSSWLTASFATSSTRMQTPCSWLNTVSQIQVHGSCECHLI